MSLKQLLEGYSLVTAEILYRMPDYRTIIQSYIWQEYDMHPDLPKLHSFLDFWETNLDGPLYKVTVSHSKLISPTELRVLDDSYLI
jgi:uncharacterized protein Usg